MKKQGTARQAFVNSAADIPLVHINSAHLSDELRQDLGDAVARVLQGAATRSPGRTGETGAKKPSPHRFRYRL